MELSHQARGSYTEVTANGRLNMVSAPTLRAYVGEVVASGSNRIVVNLAQTTFMDSSGLGALIGCLKAARQAGGDLRIAAVQPQVKMVLELTSMDRVLTSYSSTEEAFGNE
ncbi:STAS domain-containing protein [Paeniglutamicibacter psychrophenolicus]|uniref:Anti-sigma factor antagonist n=1 Tax=Paeniglutamicibacter psychrophenolicus TaxID=257454 RepID=A0ABS4WJI6_9MICC|nr:STAS domain-containing protein [Paeniglutamicibacter psychrophenolicus]MBP2376196.1 anti-sigma B factor antagonist [Paeniglutamicibacter psychrophenolicus]